MALSIDFENIERRCAEIAQSEEYKQLVQKVKRVKKIFLMGNGGLHFVSQSRSKPLSFALEVIKPTLSKE